MSFLSEAIDIFKLASGSKYQLVSVAERTHASYALLSPSNL